MPASRNAKGKGRAPPTPHNDSQDSELTPSSSQSTSAAASPAPVAPPVRKPRRAETRPCPICEEPIPLRLLAQHAALELSRVDNVISQIGAPSSLLKFDPAIDASPQADDPSSAGPSVRRSALKARKAITPRSTWATDAVAWLGQTTRTIRTLERHRKERHVALRDAPPIDDDILSPRAWRTCPVCHGTLPASQDRIHAHVDACIARVAMETEDAAARAQFGGSPRREEESDDGWEEFEVDGAVRVRPGDRVLRASGFHIRAGGGDIDEDVDIDGDDMATFGVAQFTERDVVHLPDVGQAVDVAVEADLDVDIDGDDPVPETLRDLLNGSSDHRIPVEAQLEQTRREMEIVLGIADGDIAEQSILASRDSGDASSVIQALENKIRLLQSTRLTPANSAQCRICLDAYTEPTVSTGCWHTCCRSCWLRCLGATKLCPMCKRITAAGELRRVYL